VNRKTGATADNLAKGDFELKDNGAPAEIVHFSRGEMPLSVVLLIDAGARSPYVMSSLRRNVAQWLRQLRPEDEIALMGFGGNAEVLQDFTRNRKLIAAGIRDFDSLARQRNVFPGQDRTAAVFQAAEYMDKAANPIGRRVIITITDDTPRSLTMAESGATARLLLDSGCVVYAMVAKSPGPSRTRKVASAAAQGALYSPDQLAWLLAQIKNRYVVGIADAKSPTAASAPATLKNFHPLKVKLTREGEKRHGDLSIATAQGHYSREQEGNAEASVKAGTEAKK
jgi:VWFA-related protein